MNFSSGRRFLKVDNFFRFFKKKMSSKGEKNRLQFEKSPYLLQHQTNPVDWYPWGNEAFEAAKSQGKPIFLSVGYSTCHWCHVMERESFENPDVARVMNSYFINIKVDREERPDIDRIYMTFVQALSGGGGWPMSVWMEPNLKPFYAGTYFPPDDRYFGRPGFKALLTTIHEQWEENKASVVSSAKSITEKLTKASQLSISEIPKAEEAREKCISQLIRSFEPMFGGFSNQPKFPQPVNLEFLLACYEIEMTKENPKGDILKMIEKTLKEMGKGGIHDHIGQGFARYSTDKKWHVPHFEKMLYDQAQLSKVYTKAWQLTKNPLYSIILEDILTYVGRDLNHKEGGFYSAEDADSFPEFSSTEKKEGAFYVWTNDEINNILSKSVKDVKYSDIFTFRFGVEEKGNVEPYSDPHEELKNQNVIFEAHTLEEILAKFKQLSLEEVEEALKEAKSILYEYRNTNRPRPHLDNKFIASWNGLMISAFVQAGVILEKKKYIERAIKASDFIDKYFAKESDLLRTYYCDENGELSNLNIPISGCVDDFANLISARIELYLATLNYDYLDKAIKMQETQDSLFWDGTSGGYFMGRKQDPSIIIHMKDDDDGAEPSSNSVALFNLIRLFVFTHNDEQENKIKKTFAQFADRLKKVPIALPLMTTLLIKYEESPRIKLIIKDLESSEMLKFLQKKGDVLFAPVKYSDKERILESDKLNFKNEFEIFDKENSETNEMAFVEGKNDTGIKSLEELQKILKN